jgi:uncharacterized membrane protein YphA (DoxX/SURF4 family)
MVIAIWTIQILLGLLFLFSGCLKVFRYQKAKAMMPWVGDVPKGLVICIGIFEILGALGLLLPFPEELMVLKPVASIGLFIIMILAAAFHSNRGEDKASLVNVGILILVSFIVYAHWTHIVHWTHTVMQQH